MNNSLGQRLRYNAWANDLLYQAMKVAEVPEGSLRAFQHVLETEMTWSGRMLGLEGANVALWGTTSWQQCDEWLVAARGQLEQVAAAGEADGHTGTFTYRNSTGREFENAAGEVMDHMLLHSAQYRGEAAGLSNAAGKQMPDFDMIVWLRNGQPAVGE